jgi:hypothetical protein
MRPDPEPCVNVLVGGRLQIMDTVAVDGGALQGPEVAVRAVEVVARDGEVFSPSNAPVAGDVEPSHGDPRRVRDAESVNHRPLVRRRLKRQPALQVPAADGELAVSAAAHAHNRSVAGVGGAIA